MRRATIGETDTSLRKGAEGSAVVRAGGAAMSAGARRAATQGVVNGLRSLYSDTLAEPLSGDLKDLLERFSAAGRD